MSRKKKMTPAQKAAARWDEADAVAPEDAAETAVRKPDQAPPSFSTKNVLVAAAGIVLVAVAGYFSMGGMAG